MSKYINPFTDFGFKKLFGEEDSKDILIGFLNDLLPIKDKIKSIEFKKSEQLGFSDISRKAIYDVYCTDEKGSRFIGENELETNFDKWLYFLKNLEDFNSIPDILKNTIFEKAFNKAELANFDETQKLDYERSVKIYRDNCNVIQSSFDDGIEQGIEQGILISKREDILENLSELGTVSSDLIFKIENQCDVEILKKWLKVAIKSDSIEEFRKTINM